MQKARQQEPVVKVELAEPAGTVIPLSECPPELKYLAQGKTVGLQVLGRLTPEGVLVEGVVLMRGR